MKTTLFATCLTWGSIALLPSAAKAQGRPEPVNMDIYFLFGATATQSLTVPGSNMAVSGTTSSVTITGYDYRLANWPRGSLWLEFIPVAYFAASQKTSTSTLSTGTPMIAPGLRYMVPVKGRLSAFGAAGAGVGFFKYLALGSEATPILHTIPTTHGVFDFGGGVDIRLSRAFSLRIEARDYITGMGLSGEAGRSHLMAGSGIVFHF